LGLMTSQLSKDLLVCIRQAILDEHNSKPLLHKPRCEYTASSASTNDQIVAVKNFLKHVLAAQQMLVSSEHLTTRKSFHAGHAEPVAPTFIFTLALDAL
jgi:hypothetical protein